MPYFLKGDCVHKGTEEEPGELVKCHEDHAAAVAHMRALYANVDDATKQVFVDVDGEWVELVKGGSGSGWHRPPRGTHNAENAPNFAGGPGADREYGTESDEPPNKTRRCKCVKCGAVVVLPKGKRCEDIDCPACEGGMRQTEPREDKPAEGEGGREPKPGRKKAVEDEEPCPACEEAEKAAVGEPGATIHGSGGAMGEVSEVMEDEREGCKCPKCGKGIPCTAKACPYCKENVDPERSGGEEKAVMKSEGDGEHPAGHYLVVEDPEKPTTWHLRVRGTDGKLDHTLMGGAWAALHGGYRGNKYAGPNKEMALAKLKRFYEQEGMDVPGEEKSFVSYKSADGTWRWLTLSNWAVVDKEAEVVSEQAYRDAIAHAKRVGDWGQLDLVHVDGTDVGDCDTLFVVKSGDEPAKFGGGGTWYDTPKAIRAREAIQADPAHWGVSIKFRFNPARKVKGIYTGDIQVLKHTILPQAMAASYGTAIAVQGGTEMQKALDEKTAAALAALGHTPDEIEELAEKQKALPPEENVAHKEDTTATAPERTTLWKQLGQLLGIGSDGSAPDASRSEEARKTDEVAPTPAAEPAETKAVGGEDEAETEKAEAGPDPSVLLGALGEAMAKSMGEMVRAELAERDKRIQELEALVRGMGESVEEKVAQRLRDVPPVVTVAASQVAATAVDEAPKGLTFGNVPPQMQEFTKSLLDGIRQVVEDKTGAQYQV